MQLSIAITSLQLPILWRLRDGFTLVIASRYTPVIFSTNILTGRFVVWIFLAKITDLTCRIVFKLYLRIKRQRQSWNKIALWVLIIVLILIQNLLKFNSFALLFFFSENCITPVFSKKVLAFSIIQMPKCLTRNERNKYLISFKNTNINLNLGFQTCWCSINKGKLRSFPHFH